MSGTVLSLYGIQPSRAPVNPLWAPGSSVPPVVLPTPDFSGVCTSLPDVFLVTSASVPCLGKLGASLRLRLGDVVSWSLDSPYCSFCCNLFAASACGSCVSPPLLYRRSWATWWACIFCLTLCASPTCVTLTEDCVLDILCVTYFE